MSMYYSEGFIITNFAGGGDGMHNTVSVSDLHLNNVMFPWLDQKTKQNDLECSKTVNLHSCTGKAVRFRLRIPLWGGLAERDIIDTLTHIVPELLLHAYFPDVTLPYLLSLLLNPNAAVRQSCPTNTSGCKYTHTQWVCIYFCAGQTQITTQTRTDKPEGSTTHYIRTMILHSKEPHI